VKDVGEMKDVGEVNSEEENLLRTFYKFPEVVEQAAERFAPNVVCTFLYDLATKYNRLYNTHRILDAESEEEKSLRIALTRVTGDILKSGLNLLGIQAPRKM
jgi:arginyl-tRNA synthetase